MPEVTKSSFASNFNNLVRSYIVSRIEWYDTHHPDLRSGTIPTATSITPFAWNYWDTQGSQAEFDKFFGSNSFASMSASDISGDIVTASEAITAVQDLAYYYTRIRSVTYYTYYNEGLQHQGTAWSAMNTDYYSNLNCTLDITQNEVVKLPAFDDLRSTLVNLPSISYTYKYSGSHDEHGRSRR